MSQGSLFRNNCIQKKLTGILKKRKKRQQLQNELFHDWENFQSDSSLNDFHSEFIYEQITRQISKDVVVKRNHSFLSNHIALIKVAAFVLLALIFVGLLHFNLSRKSQQSVSIKMITVETHSGERKKVTLPDGSVVMLNSSSKLIYSSLYNAKNRTVALTGEAFFEIKHDSLNPFVVKTNLIRTKVLGTQFNVCAYPEEAVIGVAVKRGKVAVFRTKGNDEKVLLIKNQKISYSVNSDLFSHKKRIDPNSEFAWITGGIVFDNIPLKEVFRELERNYDIHIICGDSVLLNCHICGEFRNQTIQEILGAISLSARFRMEIEAKNRRVTILSSKSN